MITKTEKKRIKKIIGHRYVSLIKGELISKEEYDSKDKPFSSSMIINVMNGQEHDVIEAAIYRVAEAILLKRKTEKEKRAQILKSA